VRLNRRILANVVVFAIGFVVMVTWAVQQVVSVDQLDQPYRISAEFDNAFGVLPNAEVTYLGVGIGTVTSVRRVAEGVRIDLKIQRGERVPADATAGIARKSAIGEPYIDFRPADNATASTGVLEPGAVVPKSRTRVPLEFSELLKSASALISSIPPEDVQTLLHEASIGLEGRSEALRALAGASDQLSATFAARTDALDRLATNNTRLTHVVTLHRDDLGSSLTNLRLLADTLKKSKGDTSLLLDRGALLLGETADLVAAEKPNLDCDLKVLGVVIDETSTPRRLAELRAIFEIGPKAFGGLYDSIDVEADGPWIRVGNISNPENPPAQYIPPKAVPPVQPVAACASALRAASASGDYRPRSGGAGGSSTLPATGGPVGLALFSGGALGASWLVTRRLRRRHGVWAGPRRNRAVMLPKRVVGGG